MKILRLMAGIAIFCFTVTVSAATVNGRFIVTNTDSSKLIVTLQINTLTGNDALGGATIVLGFDTTVINFTSSPIKNSDYIFHNFCGGNYSPGTITRPMQGKLWVNIDLPFNNSSSGTLVSDTSGWTDVVSVYFDITDPEGAASLYWIDESPFWGIYDHDNITLWENGVFEDQINFPVPVELSSFTASLLENNSVLLRWSTFTSVNNLGFEVEKSVSSHQSSVGNDSTDWEKIGFVENMGNTNTLIEYSFTDESIHHSPVIKYRLKMIDFDGSFSYSDVVEVFTGPLTFELAQNYPNPFNPSTVISWQSPVSSRQTLKVYDVLGNEIATLVDEYRAAGRHEVYFDAGGLASGVYIYRLMTEDYSETKKMMLIR